MARARIAASLAIAAMWVGTHRWVRPLARRLVPRRVATLVRDRVPIYWRYRGRFARACLKNMGVGPWARLSHLQRTYTDFALSTNERGQRAADIIEQFRPIRATRGLDIGCAYGGFLVALGRRGAREMVGIDVEPRLLDLARINLAEHGVRATLLEVNIEDTARVAELGRFDVVMINDVLEHVLDLPRTIANTSDLVSPGGVLYAVVPNKYYVRYLRQDGHYELPGMTLLSRREAEAYYHHARVGSDAYSVGHYRTLPYYRRRFAGEGLDVTLFEGDLGVYDLDQLRAEFDAVQGFFAALDDPRIPPSLAPKVRRRAQVVVATFQALVARHDTLRERSPAQAAALAAEIIARFGMEAWFLIGRRPAA